MLRAVIFDLDDTLVDHRTASAAAVVSWAASHDIADPEVRARWAAISEVHYSRYQRRELTFAQHRRARVRDFFDVDVDDARADVLFSGYLERYQAAWTAFADAAPALRRAREAGLHILVLTNGEESHQRLKLEKVGLADEVDVLVASSALPAAKPDPRAFLHALDRVEADPAEALMVGDSIHHDVRGALAAGLDAVLLDRHDAHRDAGTRRIATLDELAF